MGLVYADIELINATDLTMAKRHIIGEEEIKRMLFAAPLFCRAKMNRY